MSEKNALNECVKKMLDESGYQEIYKAMDDDDLATVVKAATRALSKTNSLPLQHKAQKSAELSTQFRKKGNQRYKNGENAEAIFLYKKALALAPNKSLELQMAYGNLSAVMLTIKAYQASQLYITACLKLDCSQKLREKLEKRMSETMKFIMEEMACDFTLRSDRVLNNFINFEVKRNAEVPCASENVAVVSKRAVTAKDVPSGTIVAVERAYVSIQDPQNQHCSCYHCHRIALFLVPCEGCSKALFCSEKCRSACMKEYHRIECDIIGYLGPLYDDPIVMLATKAAIKMSLKIKWKELRAASLVLGASRLQQSTVAEAFDVDNPLSMLSTNNEREIFHGRLFNGSVIFAAVTHRLAHAPNYLPIEAKEKEESLNALSRITLHLYARFVRRIEILCSAYDFKKKTYMCGVQRNLGWFSFTSKLAHSCEPNLFAVGLNEKVALVTIRPIKKGEELTISYVDNFYDIYKTHGCEQHSHFRQKLILSAIDYRCECKVCTEDWDMTSPTEATLSKRQKQVYVKMVSCNGSYSDRLKACSAVLDSLQGMVNTKEHLAAFKSLRSVLHVCQCFKTMNKSYGIPCRDCEEVLPNKNALYKHRKKEHSDASPQEQVDSGNTNTGTGESTRLRAWACARCPRRFRIRSELRAHTRSKHPQHVAVIEIHGPITNAEEAMKVINMNGITHDRVVEINLMSFLKGSTNLVPNCARALSMLSNIPKTHLPCVRPTHIPAIPKPLTDMNPRISAPTIRRPAILQRNENSYFPQIQDGRAQNVQDLNVQLLLGDGVIVNSDQIVQLNLNDSILLE